MQGRTVRRYGQAATAVVMATLAILAATPGSPAPAAPAPAPAVLDVPFRDAVLASPGPAARRKAARADSARYAVNDGAGRTVKVEVTNLCRLSPGCNGYAPQTLATFLGTLRHSAEISSLSVLIADLETEMNTLCGTRALACYISDRRQMIVPGNEFTATDGATREFVIAHEYGHHIATGRRNPPFTPTIAYGTKRWASYERVCQGARSGVYFPGNGGSQYKNNPGEAFAEAYARGELPQLSVTWQYNQTLFPTAESLRAIAADVLNPWTRRTRRVLRGGVGDLVPRAVRLIPTGLDGDVDLYLRGRPRSDLDLVVRSARGRRLGASRGPGAFEHVRVQVCGQSALRVVIRRGKRGPGGPFSLTVRRP